MKQPLNWRENTLMTAEKKIGEVEKVGGMELMSGQCYLIEEEKLKRSLKLFLETLNRGYKGFCLTRTNPRYLKVMMENNTKIIWLTDKESATETTIPPILERIIYEIVGFLRQEERGCLILDGIEYLISNNDFKLVMRFLDDINEHVVVGHCVFILPITESTYSSKELTLLERNTVHLQDDMIKYANVLFQELETEAGGPSKEELLDTQKKQEEILDLITNAQERIREERYLFSPGDATDEAVLRAAGIERVGQG